jgi:non-ribosomal peptide synthetase component F
MARSAPASLFMVLLTAYQLLLHDQLGVDDITVPTWTFGRDDANVQVAVGFIANVVLLRTTLAGDPTMLELLERVRATCLDAYAHEVPIIRVVDRVPDAALLMCDEEAVLTPFQFFPDLGRDAVRPLGPRCTLAPHPFTSHASALPLDARLTATARGTVVTVEFEYEISRFEAETARWVLHRYVTAVEAVASGAGTRLSGVRL